jgi:surfactin synthase thioesterase subunit
MKTTYKVQLFLLHFAGGSSYSYDFLRAFMDADFEFIPLEIPGRGKRFSESLLTHKNEAIADYTQQIQKLRNQQLPYLIYGHSMGATLALSVAHEMEKINDIPLSLIVSGNTGPGVKNIEEVHQNNPRYAMSDVDFKAELTHLGGVPDEILQSDEMYSFFAPIMRSDFEILEKGSSYHPDKQIVVSTPIYALMGSEEKHCEHITNWEKYTNKTFDHQLLEGNHFFINDHPEKLSSIITNCYQKNINR